MGRGNGQVAEKVHNIEIEGVHCTLYNIEIEGAQHRNSRQSGHKAISSSSSTSPWNSPDIEEKGKMASVFASKYGLCKQNRQPLVQVKT